MYKNISDTFILKTLGNYTARTEQLYRQMASCYRQLAKDDALTDVVFPSLDGKEINVKHSIAYFHDISETYEKYKSLARSRTQDILHFMRNIVEEQESMNRILSSYEALNEKEKDILYILYIKTPDAKREDAVRALEKKYYYSRGTIFRWRRSALNHIRELYDSNLTQAEIYKLQFQNPASGQGKTIYR